MEIDLKPDLGDMLLMVLGIWSTDEETVIDRALSDNDGSSGSGEDDSSTGELLDSSVSSTSSGGGNGKGNMGDWGSLGKNEGRNVESCLDTRGCCLLVINLFSVSNADDDDV